MTQDPFDLQATVDVRLRTLTIDAATLVKNPRSTLVPSLVSVRTGRRALDVLRSLSRDPAALKAEEVIGEGGMGVVRLAVQVALDRKVAVKSLRPEVAHEHAVESLLGEAWLAGSLEHPNVVPVYDLGLDESGAPFIVMKHIEGDHWLKLLGDDEALKKHAPGRERLDAHLAILVQVCNAVHFAHSRGVIHRDLKPENVMVGSFGEVYLVDWGVATKPGPVTQIAGTPAYMAPEMLGGDGAEISPRTDVYLLGAVLYEILAGRAPHTGNTPEALVSSVLLSNPTFPEDAPAELVALARACMQRDPKARPESALAVRLALEDFLAHQGSIALTKDSETKLSELDALLATPDHDVGRLFNVFAECRFGFRQALRAWEANAAARAGLDRCVRAMVKYEIARGAGHAALTLLGDLGTKDPALEAEVKRAVAEEEAKGARLEKLERDHDVRTGGQARLIAGVATGLFWALSPILGRGVVEKYPEHEALLAVPVALFTALATITTSKFVRVGRTPLNRALFRVVVFSMFVQAAALPAFTFAYGDPGRYTVPALAFFWALVSGLVAVALDWRLWSIAAAYAASAVFGLRYPAWRYEATSVANAFFAIASAIIWSRHGLEREAARQQKYAED